MRLQHCKRPFAMLELKPLMQVILTFMDSDRAGDTIWCCNPTIWCCNHRENDELPAASDFEPYGTLLLVRLYILRERKEIRGRKECRAIKYIRIPPMGVWDVPSTILILCRVSSAYWCGMESLMCTIIPPGQLPFLDPCCWRRAMLQVQLIISY